MIVHHVMSISSMYGLFGYRGTCISKIGNMQKNGCKPWSYPWNLERLLLLLGMRGLFLSHPLGFLCIHTCLIAVVELIRLLLIALLVKMATQLQLQPVGWMRGKQSTDRAFLSEACQGLAAKQQVLPKDLRRLIVEGFVAHCMGLSAQIVLLVIYGRWMPMARMHMLGEPCAVCDHLAPDMLHHYRYWAMPGYPSCCSRIE